MERGKRRNNWPACQENKSSRSSKKPLLWMPEMKHGEEPGELESPHLEVMQSVMANALAQNSRCSLTAARGQVLPAGRRGEPLTNQWDLQSKNSSQVTFGPMQNGY